MVRFSLEDDNAGVRFQWKKSDVVFFYSAVYTDCPELAW